MKQYAYYAKILLRLSLAAIFLWFGFDKFLHTSVWIAWVPEWFISFVPNMTYLMYGQGVVEMIIGLMFLSGYKLKIAGFSSAAIVLMIELAMIGTGQLEIMLRDLVIIAASLTIALETAKPISFK